MPFVLPSTLIDSEQIALVLAFGKLSVLEACSMLGRSVQRAESPCERVAVLRLEVSSPDRVTELAGIHKSAPLWAVVDNPSSDLGKVVDELTLHLDEKSNLSLSGYEVSADDYDTLARSLLDGVRASGLRKVRLLRPRGNELLAEEVLSRKAIDVLAFPYHGGFWLGPTTWIPDSVSLRGRGTRKPTPHSDISLSPRLAAVLVNLAGLRPGQVLLDPFCGSGTILMEAYIKSLRCLGLDSSASRVQDARQNLQWTDAGPSDKGYDIRKGDTRELPRMLRGTRVDAVVTEPVLLPRLEARPRTSTARQMIDTAGATYSVALESMARVLQPGGRIVIVVPVIQTMDGEEVSLVLDGRKLGLKPYQPGPVGFEYPVRLSFESTRWVRRGVYVFESAS
ncbi:MAG: methyltransferase domain-containing protein [Thaumarchaeota archaeon]|nr:methyltransferase domain-containing protein [Nitrososphaerota archaeon]